MGRYVNSPPPTEKSLDMAQMELKRWMNTHGHLLKHHPKALEELIEIRRHLKMTLNHKR